MNMLNEKEIIDLLISRLGSKSQPRLGMDDVAVIPFKKIKKIGSSSLIFKADMLVESTDVPRGMQPWQIARKSIVACVSDLSAKGIKPYVSMISIGIPKKYSDTEIEDLANGFKIASKEFGVSIVGGDTNESRELVIDCSMIGFSGNSVAKIPKRNGASLGDLIVVSGEFGYSSSGLKILTGNAVARKRFKTKAISSVFKPTPPQKFGIALAEYFSSSMDSSDGLALSLHELSKQSHVNFFIDNIPEAKGIKEFAKDNHIDANDLIFFGGEEYEIIATIPSSKIKQVISIIRESNLRMQVIGTVKKGDGKVFVKNQAGQYSILNPRGYVHRTSPSQYN